jgi:hypothetical protein|tara:strand:- start:6309 stop:7169 length:861 start_codon:yes stop_codon:yes gene_type:complete
MKPILSEYYGDNTRWFIATVIDSSPPYGFEGRVKIRVHGLHTSSTVSIPQHDLPWAQCLVPTTEGGISGIGRMPQVQPNALVFGMFMDGMNSQTPIVMGSLPHIELPTRIQLGQEGEDIGEDNKPENLWQSIVAAVKPKDVDIQNDNSDNINNLVRLSREKTAVKFFLNLGYTVKQSIGLVSSLGQASGMRTGVNVQSSGLARFSRLRYNDLQNFSNEYNKFMVQLAFIAYELNGTQTNANIKLLQSDKFDGKDGVCSIVCKYYLKDSSLAKQSQLAARRMNDRIG